jgi:hypothetical protein
MAGKDTRYDPASTEKLCNYSEIFRLMRGNWGG